MTPTPRAAFIIGKCFSSGIRALVQVLVVLVLGAVLGVALSTNPLHIAGALAVVLLGVFAAASGNGDVAYRRCLGFFMDLSGVAARGTCHCER